MKKIEPTKNVTSMPGREVRAHCAAIAAIAKQSEPTENSTLIHQARLRGRHQTGSVRRVAGRSRTGPAPLAVLARAPAHLAAVGAAQRLAA